MGKEIRDSDADLASGTRPSWVLLDFNAFVLDKRNSTTATCVFMGDKLLQVTFVVAQPPQVSYFCVYCRGFNLGGYTSEVKLVATEADLALIRIYLSSSSSPEYFIYRAGEGQLPWLEHLPRPRFYLLQGDPLGILKYDTGYMIVSLGDDTSALYRGSSPGEFEVYLYDSKAKVWTVKPVDLPGIDKFYHYTSKVITIGGEHGTVAFVDLWRGILLYDVLANDSQLCYIPLPEAICASSIVYSIDPLLLRDIAVVEGKIKYLEMSFKIMTNTGFKGPVVATYSMPAPCCQEDAWHPHGMIHVSEILDDKNLLFPEALRMMTDEERIFSESILETMKTKPISETTLHAEHPTLSLDDEDTVYFLTKFQPMSKKACVIAVSMSGGSIEAVARFGADAERTYGVNFNFIKSRISSYLIMAPGTEGAGSKKKRKGKKDARKVVLK